MAMDTGLFCPIPASGFLVGIHNGQVALWQGCDPAPIYITQYPARLLPECDRQALLQGIIAADRAAAASRLEDFSS